MVDVKTLSAHAAHALTNQDYAYRLYQKSRRRAAEVPDHFGLIAQRVT